MLPKLALAAGVTAITVVAAVRRRRPMLLGLVYVLVWEGLLGNFVTGARVVSIQQYAVTLADAIGATDLLAGRVSVPVAVVMSVAVTAGATEPPMTTGG